MSSQLVMTAGKSLATASAELITIYGRRRVGNTFLIRSVYEKQLVFEFTGVHNAKMPEQLENFSIALTKATGSPVNLAAPASWSAAFDILEKFLTPSIQKKKMVIFFDEFPWINSQKSNFLKSFMVLILNGRGN